MTANRIPNLSKSRYTSFLLCPRLGYLRCYPRRFSNYKTPFTPAQEARFATGHRVGELAREYWPDGLLIDEGPREMGRAIKKTRIALDSGADTVFEATLSERGLLVRTDILCRLPSGAYEITEVKSSASVKGGHIPDIAVQMYVVEGQGYPILRANIMHLDRDYIHSGGVTYDLGRLFTLEDVTDRARTHITQELPDNLENIHMWLAAAEPPPFERKSLCRNCEYYPLFCSEDADEDVVGGPRANTGEARSTQEGGQASPVEEAEISTELRGSLETWEYPLHFFDFEAWNPALPVFPGSRPYEFILFQWSDHRLDADGTVDHAHYLADGNGDPRRGVAESLIERLAEGGSVIVYHDVFERTRLRDLAALFPDLAPELERAVGRLVDLKKVISAHVTHPAFRHGLSLKNVLPVLVPELSYDHLQIANGDAANLTFERLLSVEDPEEKQQIRSELLDYCAMDTRAMLEIYMVLRRLSLNRPEQAGA